MSISLILARAFVNVAKMGSISAASEMLNLNPSTVSRQIRTLENELGCVLFRRNNRRIRITDVGKEVLAHFKNVIREIDAIYDVSGNITSVIRITSPQFLGRLVLIHILKKYQEMNPKLRFYIDCNDSVRNYVDEQFDIGISGCSIQSELLVAKPVGQLRLSIVMSAERMKKYPPITDINMLSHMVWVVHQNGMSLPQKMPTLSDGTTLTIDQSIPHVITTDSKTALTAILEGMGVGIVEQVGIKDELESGALVELFPNSIADLGQYWIYSPEGRIQSDVVHHAFTYIEKNLIKYLQ